MMAGYGGASLGDHAKALFPAIPSACGSALSRYPLRYVGTHFPTAGFAFDYLHERNQRRLEKSEADL